MENGGARILASFEPCVLTDGSMVLYNVDLNGQITGPDPATGNPVTLNGNINALFLLNKGGQNVEFNGDNSVALNAVLKR
jgi:hypothetical protein